MRLAQAFAVTAALLMMPTASPAQPTQHYRLDGGPDVASGLRLHASGRFEYFLSAGALDEQAAGTWKREGDVLRLTTVPKPRPAQFTLDEVQRIDGAPLTVKVVWPDGRGVPLVDLAVEFTAGDPVEGYTQEDGWSLDADETRTVRSIRLAVPMHGLVSPVFPIDPVKGNILRFVLTPHDLGIVDFDDIAMSIEDDRLTMYRNGVDLFYLKAR